MKQAFRWRVIRKSTSADVFMPVGGERRGAWGVCELLIKPCSRLKNEGLYTMFRNKVQVKAVCHKSESTTPI